MSAAPTAAKRTLGIVTLLSLAVVTVSTHWPGVNLGTPEDPAPDKIMHLVTFGLLTCGAWYAGWFRTLPQLWIAGLLWSALDEWTQGLSPFGRMRDWQDWVANALGVTIAIAWIAATRPIGGWQSRRRRAVRDRALAEVFSHRWAWLVPPAAALIGAAAAYPVFRFVASKSWAMPPRQVIVTGLMVLAFAAAVAAIEILVRMLRPSPFPTLSDRAHIKLLAGPVLAAFGVLILFMVLAQAMLILRPHVATVALAEEWYRRRPQTFRAAIDLALILFLAAWACRRARTLIARRVDLSHERCISCDHTLKGLRVPEGVGRCPECGAPYEVPPDVDSLPAAPLASAAPAVPPGAP